MLLNSDFQPLLRSVVVPSTCEPGVPDLCEPLDGALKLHPWFCGFCQYLGLGLGHMLTVPSGVNGIPYICFGFGSILCFFFVLSLWHELRSLGFLLVSLFKKCLRQRI